VNPCTNDGSNSATSKVSLGSIHAMTAMDEDCEEGHKKKARLNIKSKDYPIISKTKYYPKFRSTHHPRLALSPKQLIMMELEIILELTPMLSMTAPSPFQHPTHQPNPTLSPE
jgi:hypothetical protein